MRHYAILTGSLVVLFLGLFFVAEWLQVPILTDPGYLLARAGWVGAFLGFGLLVADVVLPVPSSLIMTAHGLMFGVVLGTLLSTAGAFTAALVAFGIGRRGGSLLARLVPAPERARADAMLERWGALAIIVTRPVPILAETLAILAGTSSMGWGNLSLAALAGSFPIALAYAVAGTAATGPADSLLVFALVLLAAGLFWSIGRRTAARSSGRSSFPAR